MKSRGLIFMFLVISVLGAYVVTYNKTVTIQKNSHKTQSVVKK